MAQVCKVEGQVEINSAADKFFVMLTENQHQIPKLCPGEFPRVELQEGDWTSVGSIRKWDYVIYGKTGQFKEKIEEVDEVNKALKFTIVDGDSTKKHYKNFRAKLQVVPKGKGSMVKCTFKYEKLNENAPEANMYLDFLLNLVKDVDCKLANA